MAPLARLGTTGSRGGWNGATPSWHYAPRVDQREPLTKREDLLVFGVIALPIFAVTILIITLVVVLGTR